MSGGCGILQYCLHCWSWCLGAKEPWETWNCDWEGHVMAPECLVFILFWISNETGSQTVLGSANIIQGHRSARYCQLWLCLTVTCMWQVWLNEWGGSYLQSLSIEEGPSRIAITWCFQHIFQGHSVIGICSCILWTQWFWWNWQVRRFYRDF